MPPRDRLKHDADGCFDDLVLDGGTTHLERMDDHHASLVLSKDGKKSIINLVADGGKLVIRVEEWEFDEAANHPELDDSVWGDERGGT